MIKQIIQLMVALVIVIFLASACGTANVRSFNYSIIREADATKSIAGRILSFQYDPPSEEILQLNDRAFASHIAGNVELAKGNYEEAEEHFKTSIILFRQLIKEISKENQPTPKVEGTSL